ncbi:MAG TPA: ABC transporter permease [Gemmatimonadaceae bacterium]|nr:ABC transporter permease [Gemmatimonadaceae bacterium]
MSDPATPALAATSPIPRYATPVLRVVLVAAVAVGALAALLAAAGYDAALALGALWEGSVGSWYAIGSATLVRATPLVLAGLAVSIAFRAGVFNIGAEGQLLAGASAATAVALGSAGVLGRASVLAALVAGALAGGAWAGIAAWLRRRFRVLEVISTIMLNFIALHAVGWLVRGPLQEPTRIYPQSSSLPDVARLPRLLPDARVHWGLVLAVAACVGAWWVLRHTAAGFRLRAAGANPSAARVAGLIDVDRVTSMAFLASGALAGLAGASEVGGVTYALYESLSPGYGYTAIAVALLARLHPLGVVATGLLFGALEAGATAMQRDAGVPSVVVAVVEAALILVVVALESARWRARAAEAGT